MHCTLRPLFPQPHLGAAVEVLCAAEAGAAVPAAEAEHLAVVGPPHRRARRPRDPEPAQGPKQEPGPELRVWVCSFAGGKGAFREAVQRRAVAHLGDRQAFRRRRTAHELRGWHVASMVRDYFL